MLVRDVMTADPLRVRVDKKVIVVSEIMDWGDVRHVPVVDAEQRLVGLLTKTDLLKISLAEAPSRVNASGGAGAENGQHLWEIPIPRAMTRDVRTIAPMAPVQHAAALMRLHKFGCLPVCLDGKLLGIVSETDLLRIVEEMPDDVVFRSLKQGKRKGRAA